MKALRDLLDKFHPLFTKGGKLERLYPLYEAGDTFLYTPGEVTKTGSHVRDSLDLKRMMSFVIVALVPCILMALYNTGYQANLAYTEMGAESIPGWRGALIGALGIGHDPSSLIANIIHGALYFIPVYAVCMAVGGTCELIFSIIRRHEINEGFLVTGMLFPLTLPPTIPLWQVAAGIAFAIILAKEIYGGTGKNFLNPALTARAFLYFAFPGFIIGRECWVAADGYTKATSLGAIADAGDGGTMDVITDPVAQGGLGIEWMNAFVGFIPGSMGETSALAALIGAAILIGSGIGSWRVMAGCVVGALGVSTLFFGMHLAGMTDTPTFAMPPWWHLVIGGFAFGTVFMATDPVSSSMTFKGMWIYGILIGVMTILIRVVNPAFPEGIMLAILFGNVFAPVIDYYVVQENINRRLARVAA